MTPKSGYRFSDKVMLKQEARPALALFLGPTLDSRYKAAI
jgi:hypothetical protein